MKAIRSISDQLLTATATQIEGYITIFNGGNIEGLMRRRQGALRLFNSSEIGTSVVVLPLDYQDLVAISESIKAVAKRLVKETHKLNLELAKIESGERKLSLFKLDPIKSEYLSRFELFAWEGGESIPKIIMEFELKTQKLNRVSTSLFEFYRDMAQIVDLEANMGDLLDWVAG